MLAKPIWGLPARRRALDYCASEMRRTESPPSSHGGVRDDLRATRLPVCSGPNAQAAGPLQGPDSSHLGKKHGIRPVGFWTMLVRESGNELTHMLPWGSMADRETR